MLQVTELRCWVHVKSLWGQEGEKKSLGVYYHEVCTVYLKGALFFISDIIITFTVVLLLYY